MTNAIEKQPIQYEIVLNNNQGYCLFGFNCEEKIVFEKNFDGQCLDDFIAKNQGKYIFNALSYRLKNEFLSLSDKQDDQAAFPIALFWVAETVVELNQNDIKVLQGKMRPEFLESIEMFRKKNHESSKPSPEFQLKPRTSREKYLSTVEKIKKNIQYGDIYEVNYCMEYFSENTGISNPKALYLQINQHTSTPFSVYLQTPQHTVLSFSPERFMKKTGDYLLSEPIKGTLRRGINQEEDLLLANRLLNDPKERNENIMIVDLVRNDFSKIACKSSVQVESLCEIKTYPTVHQMVSSISCKLNTNSFHEILKATFPMGSMTGVPKKRALELMEKYEDFNRGLYSGSIGYIHPNGDFDQNVVIRTLIENKDKKYISVSVGSAITINSDSEKEFDECQIKIHKIMQILNGNH